MFRLVFIMIISISIANFTVDSLNSLTLELKQFIYVKLIYSEEIRLPFYRAVRHQHSQAARQGLAVLMASAVVVLQHETTTLHQCHNFISIDFKFGMGNYVREVTSEDKVGSGPRSGRAAMWGQHIRVL